jgi:glyoxylase-like metal-dependent hydrolase (beta-lactamase superfamily II)
MQFGIPTQALSEHLLAVRTLLVNFYIYRKGKTIVGFDAGLTTRGLGRELEKVRVSPAGVSHVFLTHSDIDHTGGLRLFTGARVLASKLEEPLLKGTARRFFVNNAKFVGDCSLLSHDETIHIDGIRIRTISTPGHTPGSMSYLVDDSILIVGDTIELRGNRSTTGTFFLNADVKQQEASLKMLAKLDGIQMLCTCHSGISRDYASAMKPWRVQPDSCSPL